MLRLQHSGMAAVDFFNEVDTRYGVDEDGLPGETDYSGVEVPEGGFTLTPEQLANLQQAVDPLRESNSYGTDLYEEALLFIDNM